MTQSWVRRPASRRRLPNDVTGVRGPTFTLSEWRWRSVAHLWGGRPDVTVRQTRGGAFTCMKGDWAPGDVSRQNYASAPYEVERPRSSCHAYLRSCERDDRGNRLAGDDSAPHKMTSQGNGDGDEGRYPNHRTTAKGERTARGYLESVYADVGQFVRTEQRRLLGDESRRGDAQDAANHRIQPVRSPLTQTQQSPITEDGEFDSGLSRASLGRVGAAVNPRI
jgi:hypothetical protein